MTTPAATPFRLTERCPRCQQPVGPKHRETCPGPMQRIADPPAREPDCGCPPGAWHLKTCEVACWPDNGGEAA